MKKLILIITTLLITLLLSGCDLFGPEQIDQISEEFCRENPTSEICDGDPVGDLEDGIVLDAFNLILAGYLDTANTTFCDDYFAVSNIVLLDACRANRSELAPEDYSDYTVVGVTKKTTLSTEDVYEVEVISADLLTEIIFTIGLVNIEGIMYIDAWSYDVTIIEPADLVMTLAIAQAYFEQFIADYLDTAITSEAICTEYLFGESVSECATERDESLALGFNVTLDNMVDLGGGLFEVNLGFSDTANPTPEPEIEEITFEFDVDGNIVMTFMDQPDPVMTLAIAQAYFEQFLADYLNTAITSETVCSDYLFGESVADCAAERDESLALGFNVTFESMVDLGDNLFLVELGFSDTANPTPEIESEEITFEYDEDENIVMTFMDHHDGEVTLEIAQAYFEQFIADYLNTSITSTIICEQYNMGDSLTGCIEDRDEGLAIGFNVTLDAMLYMGDGIFEIELGFSDTANPTPEIQFEEVFFGYDEFGNIFMEFVKDHENFLNSDEVFVLMQQFLVEYLDETVTDQEINDKYFDGMMEPQFFEGRAQDLLDGVLLEVLSVVNPNGDDIYSFLEVNIRRTKGTEIEESLILMRIRDFEDGTYYAEIIFDYQNFLNVDDTIAVFEQFIIDYLDPTITFEQFNEMYFDNTMDIGFQDERENDQAENITIVLISIIDPYPDDPWSYYEGELQITKGTEVENEMFPIRIVDLGEGRYHVDLSFGDMGPDYNMLYGFIEDLIAQYLDPTITDSDVCNYFFEGEEALGCMEDRQNQLLELNTIEFIGLYFYNGMYEVEFFFDFIVGEDETQHMFVEYYFNEFNELKVKFNDGHYLMPWDDVNNYLTNYMNDFNNNELTSETVCMTYFEDWAYDECVENRDQRQYNQEIMSSFNLWEEYGKYVVEFHYMDSSNNYNSEKFFIYPYYYDEFNNVRAHIEHYFYVDFPWDEAWDHINALVNDFNDLNLDSATVCALYFDAMDVDGCIEKREFDILNLTTITEFYLYVEHNNYKVGFTYEDNLGNIWYEDVYAEFFYNESNQLFVKFNGEYKQLIPYQEAWDFIISYQNTFNDHGVDNHTICSTYFGDSSFQYCIDRREDSMANDIYIVINQLYEMEGMYFVDIEYYSNVDGHQYTETAMVFFFYDEFNNLRMDFDLNIYHQVNYDEAYAYVNQFIIDFVDTTISNADFCYMYFPWQDSTNCIWDRENLILSTTQIQIDYLIQNYGDFEIGVTITDTISSLSRSEVLFVNFYYDDMGQIQMNIYDIVHGQYVDFATVQTVFTAYVADYIDPLVTFDYINQVYFDYRLDTQFEDERNISLTDGSVYAVISITDPNNGDGTQWIKVEIERTLDGSTESMLLWVKVFLLDNGNYLMEFSHMDYPQPVISFDAAYTYLELFIVDYNDLGITSEVLCNTYFSPEDYQGCFDKRENDIAIGQYAVLQNLDQFPDGYFVDFGYFIDLDEFLYNEFIPVFFYYDEDSNLKMKFHYDDYQGPFLGYDEGLNILNSYFVDYMDETILSTDFCSMYHEGWMVDECVTMRDEVFFNDFAVRLGDFRMDDYRYVVVFDFYDLTDNYLHSETFEVEFYENYSAIYFNLHLYYGYYDPLFEEMRPILENFFIEYANTSITSIDHCALIFTDTTNCITEREQLLFEELVFVDLWDIYFYHDEMNQVHYLARVYYEFTDGSYEVREYEVFITKNADLSINIELVLIGMQISVPADAVLLNEADTIVVLTQFALDYADNTITHEELCITYFGGVMNTPDCMEGRQEFIDSLGTVTFSYMDLETDLDGINYYMAHFEMVIGTETKDQTGPFRVYLLTDGNYFLEFVRVEEHPDPS